MKPSEIIREYGWMQGKAVGNSGADPFVTPFEDCGGFCPVGAIMRVAAMKYGRDAYWGVKPDVKRLERLLDVQAATIVWATDLKAKLPCGFDNISAWNDHRDRTKEEVIAKLEEVGL